MIKVLQVVGGMNRAGAETMLMNLYRNINREAVQFDFLVYTDTQQDYENEIKSLGGNVIHMPCKPGWQMIFSIPKIRNILRKDSSYKAIHIHTLLNSVYPLLAATCVKGIKKITHSHSTHNTTYSSFIRTVYENISKFLIQKLSDVYLACGQKAGEFLFGRTFNTRGKTIKNAIPFKQFCYDHSSTVAFLKKELNIDEELVIGSIARLEPVKNHAFMLLLAKELKERNIKFKFLIVGKGELRQELEKQVRHYNLTQEVIFLGTRNDIPQLMHLFDVLLMPSLFEGTPVTLIEAQACMLPCLISKNIPEDADLKLGLIKQLSLDAPVRQWLEFILSHNRKNKPNVAQEVVRQAFLYYGYDAEESAKSMEKIYLGS